MAYNVAYTIGSLSVPGTIILTDTSTGSDPNLVSRSISLFQADGTLLGGAVIDFPYGEGNIKTISIGVDYSLNIVLTAVSSSPLPPPSAYTASGLFTFTGFSYEFWNSLIGAVSFTYTIVADTNWLTNSMRLVLDILNATQAGATNQQASAQANLADAQYLKNNQTLFY